MVVVDRTFPLNKQKTCQFVQKKLTEPVTKPNKEDVQLDREPFSDMALEVPKLAV